MNKMEEDEGVYHVTGLPSSHPLSYELLSSILAPNTQHIPPFHVYFRYSTEVIPLGKYKIG